MQSSSQSNNARHYVSVSSKPILSPAAVAPASSQQSIQSTSLSHDAPTSISIPSKIIRPNTVSAVTKAPSPPLVDSRDRNLGTISSSKDQEASDITSGEDGLALGPSQPGESQNEHSELSSLSSLHTSPDPEFIAATTSATKPQTIATDTVVENGDNLPPAAKRRKIQELRQETPTPTISQTNVNTPIPSTETDGVITGAQEAETHPSTTHSTTIQQPAQARSSRISAKVKVKQGIEGAAAETVMDTTRGSLARTKRPTALSKPRTKKPGTQKAKNIEKAAANVIADVVEESSRKRKYKRRNPRTTTPEGAEEVKIVPSQTTMSELCKNLRTGKKSTRELELEKLDEERFNQKKQRELQEFMGQDGSSVQVLESADEKLERLARERDGAEVSREVPNTVIIDGQIQIDETSLQLDRHANAAVQRDAEQLEGIDESELTRRVNQATWLKRDKSGSWNEELTDRFYSGLRMFGTDFEMISKLFPGRTRHSVKLKFSREEKLDGHRIQQTLLEERIPVDMDEFSRLSNTVYADPRELEREMEQDRKRMEQEYTAEKEAMEELRRQRETEAAAEAAAVHDPDTEENRAGEGQASSVRERKGKKVKGKKAGRGKKTVKGAG